MSLKRIITNKKYQVKNFKNPVGYIWNNPYVIP